MKSFRRAQLYFHTIRFLRPIQIWGRILFKLNRPKPDLKAAPPLRSKEGEWVQPAHRPVSILSPSRFKFLNVEGEITAPEDWNSQSFSKLWLYNLHYFDFLNIENSEKYLCWQRVALDRWINENPPALGNGWEPYPSSLRIINWIKWHLAGNELDDAQCHSLVVQVRFLMLRLERHILGNHLFVNAKALVFAGSFFDGEEAQVWLTKGLSILTREIPEQILDDGGQYERSPMYHALAYEDMLDLVNISRAFPTPFVELDVDINGWNKTIKVMGTWLRTMCHPDGEIAFFNDAAIGIAPSPELLFKYAQRLKLATTPLHNQLTHLKTSGYIRVQKGGAVLLIDVAPVGPDYIPGHAHADTLSYELSLFGKRILVNSGTSVYGLGGDRDWQRSTAAHNTVEIDQQSSSEVWSGFRVARRALPFDVSIKQQADITTIEAAHDGYRRLDGQLVHRRRWVLGENTLEVYDIIEGRFSQACSRLYFHPEIEVDHCELSGSISFNGREAYWKTGQVEGELSRSHWHPEFGISVDNKCLTIPIFPSTPSCRFDLQWS